LGYFFPHGKSYGLIWTKTGLGYILGDFFTNSSGHPGWRRQDLGKKSNSEAKAAKKDF
jgi:hypothetical protein